MFKQAGLKTKMLISVCSVVVISYFVTITYVAVTASGMAKQSAFQLAEEMAYRYGTTISSDMNNAANIARNLAQVLAGMKATGEMLQRDQVNSIMKHLLEKNTDIFGVWTVWEPNAFDGKDAEYAGTDGHDESGRFIPYWNRSGGIHLEQCMDFQNNNPNNAYYKRPLDSGKEILMEPVVYEIAGKNTMVVSICVPILWNDRPVGVAGVDFSMDKFAEYTNQIKPFGSGYTFMVDNAGSFVSYPDKDLVGKPIRNYGVSSDVVTAIAAGSEKTQIENSSLTGQDSYFIYTPMQIGRSETPWSLVVSIPLSTVYEQAHKIRNTSILIGVISLVLLFVIVSLVSQRIAGPLGQLSETLSTGADQLASASTEISALGQSLSESATEQAASVEETSAALEQLASMTQGNVENVSSADALTQQAVQVIRQANASMSELTTSMAELSASSEETSKIIKTIDEIAFQTNLLALNAAVEAARAGEAGAGFAVVADEVRSLAMRAAEAARTTASLIEDSKNKVDQGSKLVEKTNEEFTQVSDSSQKIAEIISEVTAASHEQSKGIEQINSAIMEIDKVTQQVAASAEESAASSEEINAQVMEVKQMAETLSQLIGGSRQFSETGGIPSQGEPQYRPPLKSQPPREKPISPNTGKRLIKPDDLIPLDKDDFTDF